MKISKKSFTTEAIICIIIASVFFISLWFFVAFNTGESKNKLILVFYALSLSVLIFISSIRLFKGHRQVLLFMIFSLIDLIISVLLDCIPGVKQNFLVSYYLNRFLIFHTAALAFVSIVLQYSRYIKNFKDLYLTSIAISLFLLTLVHPSTYSYALSYVIVLIIYISSFATVFENMYRLFYMVSSRIRKINMLSSVLFFLFVTLCISDLGLYVKMTGLSCLSISYMIYYYTSIRA